MPRTGLIFALLGSLLQIAPISHAGDDPDTLIIGKTSDNPSRDIAGLRPLLNLVVERLAPVGITSGEIVMARDRRQMLSYLRQGKVDWITETMGMAIMLAERGDADIALVRRKYGELEYAPVIFVRDDSPVHRIEDLAGRTISFEHPGSMTGFIAPAIEIQRRGLPIALMASPRERPPEDMVGYLFSNEEVNTSTWVHKGLVDAGATANTDFGRNYQIPGAFVSDLRVIYTGKPLPRAVELFGKGMSQEVAARLTEVLLSLHESPEGAAVLAGFQETTRYDRFSSERWPAVAEIWDAVVPLLEAAP